MITEEELKYFYSFTEKKYCQKAGNKDMTTSAVDIAVELSFQT